MSTLADLKLTTKQTVTQIMHKLGIAMPSQYDWSFSDSATGTHLVNIWHDDIDEDNREIYFIDDSAEWADDNHAIAVTAQLNRGQRRYLPHSHGVLREATGPCGHISRRPYPDGFDGRIEWGHTDNRPYLRVMHIALLSYKRLKRHKDAVTIIDLMPARNSADNQGVRLLLGSEALRSGDLDHARAVFGTEAAAASSYYHKLIFPECCASSRSPGALALRVVKPVQERLDTIAARAI